VTADDAAETNPVRRSSLREQQVDLTREAIMRAFHELLQRDHPDAITYPKVAEAAGVSLRTVYRYFPTRVDLLRMAQQWFAELTEPVDWSDPRTVTDLRGSFPEMGRVFDEHRNIFRALTVSEEIPKSRQTAVARAVETVSEKLPRDEARLTAAIVGHIRSGNAWLRLHDEYGLDGDEILSALDWAAGVLIDDLRRRNEAAPPTRTRATRKPATVKARPRGRARVKPAE
jgi:AcrR family transcriptional regulator